MELTPKPNFYHCVEVMEQGIDVGVFYTASYHPAKTWGAPEDCYPEESDMDIWQIKVPDTLPEGVTKEMVLEAVEADMEAIEQAAWDDFHEVDCDD